jgi:V/A-type H+-transporting ATPase subunit E
MGGMVMTEQLQGLVDYLQEDARKQAAEEEARGKREAEDYAEGFRGKTQEMITAINDEYRNQASEECRRIKSQAEMGAKLQVLQAKHESLDKAFARALEQLTKLPDSKKKKLYLKNLLIAVERGDETLAVAGNERLLWESLIANANKELVNKGRLGQLKLSGSPAPIQGGFLLDGSSYEVNGSLESLLKGAEEKLRPEVARILLA